MFMVTDFVITQHPIVMSCYANVSQLVLQIKLKVVGQLKSLNHNYALCPIRWASLPILMGKVAQRLGQILTTPFVDFS